MSELIENQDNPKEEEHALEFGKPASRGVKTICALKDFAFAFSQCYFQVYCAYKFAPPTERLLPINESPLLPLMGIGMLALCVFANFSLPYPHTKEKRYTLMSVFGRSTFFTIQTLVAQISYFGILSYSIIAKDRILYNGIHANGIWISGQSMAMSFLFFALCWCNEPWQNDMKIYAKVHGFSFLPWQCLIHTPNAIAAVFDYFYARPTALLRNAAHPFGVYAAFGMTYASVYLSFLEYVLRSTGFSVYPFYEKFNFPQKVGFAVGICIFLSSICRCMLYWLG